MSFSLSPRHLETMLLAEILKKVDLDSVATALANIVLPVPGGPNKSTPFQGSSNPVKKWGYLFIRPILQWNHYSLFYQPLRVPQPHDIIETHIRIAYAYVPLQE